MIYSFNEKQDPELAEVGGKAKALIEMTSAGFPVPEDVELPEYLEEKRLPGGLYASLNSTDNDFYLTLLEPVFRK